MRLHSLRLQNFRQHADTRIEFETGLTGIIGPNGAGKSTILESIAWALYGKARGTRDSIRFSRAKERAPVRVELVFDLGGHRYRVVRGLTSAECFQDGGATPIANSITGVTELLTRKLGMTRSEFFHTYFTGQKELDAMASLGPTERARFLSRVLGYDRISVAQELVRETRKALVAEANGLRHGMPDRDAVWRLVSDAEVRVAVARTRKTEADGAWERSSAALADVAPRYAHAQSIRDRAQQIDGELRVAQNEEQAHARDVDRLLRELDAIAAAHQELTPLAALLATLPEQRESLSHMDALAAAEAKRQGLLERLRGLAEEEARIDERAQLLGTAPDLERETLAALATARETSSTCERAVDEQRTIWARDRQEAETRLEALRIQHADLSKQQETLEGLGEESPCPTCGRPLGASWKGVLDLLTEQIETVRIDSNYYRARAEQLVKLPESIEALEDQRRALQLEVRTLERRLARIQQALVERAQLAEQRVVTTGRLEDTRKALALLPMGYDAAKHQVLRRDVAELAEVERRAARLSGLVEREVVTRAELSRAQGAREQSRLRVLDMQSQAANAGITDAEFLAVKSAHEAAAADARRAELEAVAASADVERARSELDAAEKARKELVRLQERLDQLEAGKRMHEELDRAFTDIRTDLNFALRPELSEVASRFLDALTDGRYSSIELDDEYRLIVIEEGVPKPVISGGEEDLCNLVLRLAISQMIAERAGQTFSLLILDEVFGSLDDVRRGNVIELLRKLNHRFEQVIVITHIDQVRDDLDRVLQVGFDEETGASTVTQGAMSASDGDSPILLDFDGAEPLVAELT
jgi:exonuclease SbcC